MCSEKSLVGQSPDGGRRGTFGTRAENQRTLGGAGQPLFLRAAVLSAGEGQREAGGREPCEDAGAEMVDAGSADAGHGLTQ